MRSFSSLILILLGFPVLMSFLSSSATGIGLSGKIIVIDPGHAPDTGAVGLKGLTEMELNLKVAQYLKESLTKAGATVYLTREDERGAYSGQTVAKHELAARVKLATEQKCDLFVSIHHNSNAQEDRSVNQTEVYFNVYDFGPSKDAAELIYDSLIKELDTPRGFSTPMPAEYYVLRKANGYPAVLGEAAYIINPQAEALLSKEEYQKKEAHGYFLGIQQYFARGICKIVDPSPADGAIITDLSKLQISAHIAEEKNGPGIDPQSLIVKLDGEEVPNENSTPLPKKGAKGEIGITRFNGDRISVSLNKPLASGEHTVTFDIRNKKGNAALQTKTTFIVHLPPASIEIKIAPNPVPPDESTDATLSALVRDSNGNLVGDGILVSFLADNQYIGSSLTQHGIASFALRGKPYVSTTLITASAGAIGNTTTFDTQLFELGMATGWITSPIGKPIAHAKIRIGQREMGETNSEGRFYIPDLTKAKYSLIVTAPGYIPGILVADIKPGQATRLDLKMTPYADGLLHDKTYIVDAAYGGTQSGPVGADGLTAAESNLRVANYLKEYLTLAGAKVIMTRTGLEAMTNIEKVFLDSTTHSDQYLIINHGSSPDTSANYSAIYHFPDQGIEFGKTLLAEFKRSFNYPFIPYHGQHGGDGLVDNSDYLIVQTYGIRIEPSLISNPQIEKLLRSESYLQREAYAIFNGVLINAGLDTTQYGEIVGTVTDTGTLKTMGDVAVALDDGTAVLSSDDQNHGKYEFRFAKPGAHRITISAKGYETQTQAVLVNPGETVTLDIGLRPIVGR